MATYLKIKNPTMYTGHCIRRSSAIFLVNAGGNTLDLQELGGWESSKVARGFLEDNLSKKISIAQKVQVGDVSVNTVLCTNETIELNENVAGQDSVDMPIILDNNGAGVSINFENCQNIQFYCH